MSRASGWEKKFSLMIHDTQLLLWQVSLPAPHRLLAFLIPFISYRKHIFWWRMYEEERLCVHQHKRFIVNFFSYPLGLRPFLFRLSFINKESEIVEWKVNPFVLEGTNWKKLNSIFVRRDVRWGWRVCRRLTEDKRRWDKGRTDHFRQRTVDIAMILCFLAEINTTRRNSSPAPLLFAVQLR